jgi:hypothetical protein
LAGDVSFAVFTFYWHIFLVVVVRRLTSRRTQPLEARAGFP